MFTPKSNRSSVILHKRERERESSYSTCMYIYTQCNVEPLTLHIQPYILHCYAYRPPVSESARIHQRRQPVNVRYIQVLGTVEREIERERDSNNEMNTKIIDSAHLASRID